MPINLGIFWNLASLQLKVRNKKKEKERKNIFVGQNIKQMGRSTGSHYDATGLQMHYWENMNWNTVKMCKILQHLFFSCKFNQPSLETVRPYIATWNKMHNCMLILNITYPKLVK